MKDRMKKIAQWRPSPVIYVCGVFVMLVLILVPLVYLTRYSVPWYDDYNYGRFAKTAMEQTPNLLNALKGAWECIRISWHAWQGTYSSIFFMVLMPGIWGEEYYQFGPLFLIVFLAVCVCTLVYTLLRTILNADKLNAFGIAIVTSSLTLVMIHTAQEGFYWYNGGVHYIGMHGFAMLLVTVAVKILFAEQKGKRYVLATIAMVLAFVTAGGNLVTSLQGLLILLGIGGIGFVKRRQEAFGLLPALAAYAGGFWLNTTAPGNEKRAENFEGWGMSPVKAILQSFVEAFEHAWEFTGWMTLLFLALMLPLIWYMVNRVDFSFRMPGLISLASVCFYATGFTPSLFSLGHGGLDRSLNAVKLTWQLLMVMNLVYWCGWLAMRVKKPEYGRMCRWWCYLLVPLAAVLIFHTEPNQAGSFSSYGAYYYIHTGEAYNFYQEYLNRVAILNSDSDTVVLQPYYWRPWFLCMGDLSDNPGSESNAALATWYGKDEVICQAPTTTTK